MKPNMLSRIRLLMVIYSKERISKMNLLLSFFVALLLGFVLDVQGQTTILSQDFEGSIPPTGWENLKTGSGNLWTTDNSGVPHGGNGAAEYLYNYDYAANAWLISSGVALTAGVTYTITYWEMTSGSAFPENLKVTVGTGNTIALQTTTLQTLASLTNSSYAQQTTTFTPGSSGTYYFGWNCYSDADMYYLNIDDILITAPAAAGTSTLSAGAGSEPATISSLVNTQGAASLNFDFTFLDDGATPATDGAASQISQIIFNQGTGNDITSWSDAILGASLTDGSNTTTTATINAGNITFSSISNASGQLGHIVDNTSKTYTLKIWLKTALGGTLPADVEGKNFVFNVANTSFTFVAGGLAATQSVSSNSTDNAVTVTATKLSFTTNKPPANVPLNDAFEVQVSATDANGNADLNNTATVTLARDPGTGTGALASLSSLTQDLVGGTYLWNDIGYNTAENFKIQASATGLGNNLSILINCQAPPGAFSITSPLDGATGCNGTVSIQWGVSANATAYDLYYCTTPGCSASQSNTYIAGVSSPYSFSASSAYTTYNFAIKARNLSSSVWSTNSVSYTTGTEMTWKGGTVANTTTWNTTTNWCGGAVPTLTDDVFIIAGCTYWPTLRNTSSVKSLTIASGATVNGGTGSFNIYGNWSNSGTFNPETGTIVFANGAIDQTIDNGTSSFYNITFSNTSNTVSLINNKLDINGNMSLTSGILSAGSQNIEVAGNWTSGATFTPGTGTVTFDGTGTSTMSKTGPVVTIYASGFEDSDGSTDGWNMGVLASNSRWVRQSSGSNAGSYNMAIDVFTDNNTATTTQSYCTTCANNYLDAYRTLDLSDYSAATLNFYWKCKGTTSDNGDRGQVLIDGVDLEGQLYNQTSYQYVSGVSLNTFCGSSRTLAFRFTMQGQSGSGIGFCIDDVSITGNTITETFNNIKVNKSSGGSLSLSSPFISTGNIEILGGTLTGNAKRINCKGDFINNGIFTPGNADFLITGTSTQTIKGSSNTSFYNLLKNTTSSLIIGDNSVADKTIEVTNIFTWTDNNDNITVGNGVKTTFKTAGDFNIKTGCSLTTNNSSIVSIAKNYTDYGIYNCNDGTIKLHGTVNSYLNKEPALEVFSDGFETLTSGTADSPNGWVQSGTTSKSKFKRLQGMGHGSEYDIAVVDFSNTMPYDYDWSPGSSGQTEISKSISLVGYTAAILKFWWRCGGDVGDYGQVFINGDDKTSLVSLTGDSKLRNNPIYTESPDIDLSAYLGTTITLKFVFKYDDDDDGFAPGLCFDDIRISTISNQLETFNNLEVEKTAASAVLLCNIDVNSNVNIISGDFKSSGNSFPVGGNWTNTGASTFTHGNNTVTFDGNNTAKAQSINIGSTTFYSVNVNNTGGTVTASTNTLKIGQHLTLTSGTLDANDQDINIKGNWENNGGTFVPRAKTVLFTGTANQKIKSNSNAFNNVKINLTNGSSAKLYDKLTLNSDITLSTGILDVNYDATYLNNNIDIAGSWYNDGAVFNPGIAMVTFNGSSTQKVNLTTALALNTNNFGFYNVTISGSTVNFYYDPNRILSVKNLVINSGKVFNLDDNP